MYEFLLDRYGSTSSPTIVRQFTEPMVRQVAELVEAHQPVDVTVTKPSVTEPVEVTKRGSAEIDTIEAPESIFRLVGEFVEPQ